MLIKLTTVVLQRITSKMLDSNLIVALTLTKGKGLTSKGAKMTNLRIEELTEHQEL